MRPYISKPKMSVYQSAFGYIHLYSLFLVFPGDLSLRKFAVLGNLGHDAISVRQLNSYCVFMYMFMLFFNVYASA